MAKKTSIEVFNQVLKELRSGKVRPVYFFSGDEDFFLDQLQEAALALVPKEQRDFNYDLLYGQEVSVENVLGIARSYPMMAERRLLIVRDFFSLDQASSGESGGSIDEFIPYVQQPNPSTLLVLISNKKPNGNSRFGKALKKEKSVGLYNFKSVPDYRLPDWIIEWTKSRHNKTMKPEAAQILAQYVGNNLLLLSTEIDKLCTFKDTSTSIETADIKNVIGLYREYSAFELEEAIFSRDIDKSLFIAEQMLQLSKANTGEIIRTVGFFYNLFSTVWQIHSLGNSGRNKAQIQEDLGIRNSWYFNKLWREASQYRLNEMPRIFEALLDADRAIKGFSKMDPASIFALMIRRIIG